MQGSSSAVESLVSATPNKSGLCGNKVHTWETYYGDIMEIYGGIMETHRSDMTTLT